jgi:hypothetical protein
MVARMNVPGPGNYASSLANKNKSPDYGFGSSTREHGSPTSIKSISPGPGNYKFKNSIGTEGNKNSIHSKLLYKPIEMIGGTTPGPGNYDSPLLKEKKAPSYGLGTGQRSNLAKSSLGPAANAYNPDMSMT